MDSQYRVIQIIHQSNLLVHLQVRDVHNLFQKIRYSYLTNS